MQKIYQMNPEISPKPRTVRALGTDTKGTLKLRIYLVRYPCQTQFFMRDGKLFPSPDKGIIKTAALFDIIYKAIAAK